MSHNRHKFGFLLVNRLASLKNKGNEENDYSDVLWVFVTTVHAQYDERDRVVTINPLRNGDGSFSKANNPLFYNNTSTDTMNAKKRQVLTSTTINPFAFRIRSIQAMCDQNSLQLNWTTIQKQNDADHFE